MHQNHAKNTLVAICLMSGPCLAAAGPPSATFTVIGSATLSGGGDHARPCDEVFLLPADKAALLIGGTERQFQMDWSFYGRLRDLRKMATSVVSCQRDGSFEFVQMPSGKGIVVAHFSWLRGKWSTGGSWIQQIDIPVGSPLQLHAHLGG